MTDDLKKHQLRTVQYDHVDGTPELAYGGLFLLIAICFYIFAKLPDLSNSIFSALIIMLVFISGGFLIGRLGQILKERVTYPRTGYVAYKRQGRPIKRSTRLMIWIGAPLLTVILLALLFLNRQRVPAQSQDSALYVMPGLTGLLFSGIWAIAGWKIAVPRYYVIAAASLLIGAGLLVSEVGVNLGMALLFGAMSLVLFASGGVTLWRYLRQNPIPQDTPDEQ
jgi:hypothetical protein